MTAPVSGLINDLDKAMKTKSSQSLFGYCLSWIVKVYIHITSKTNKSWEVVYVIEKVRNDIIKRAMSSDGFNAVLEPVGLDRENGRHPYGMTVFPLPRGKCLIWNSTYVDSFCSDCN